MNYGLPYQGNKSRIAERLGKCLPPADTFVDLFCGGCAMTHWAMLSGKYRNYLCNDINPMLPQAFLDAFPTASSGTRTDGFHVPSSTG